jgi:tRNA threonylcarbamoyladenosine biosynthesis protein TsaB
MKLLAMDTSSVACSVALQVGDSVLERHEEQPREHTRLLIPMVRTLLAEGGLETSELDAIVIGNGPGSFIGVRIAASVAQGLAYAAGVPVVPVSSMAAVAAEVQDRYDSAEVVVAQDAHMDEVYLGIYGLDEHGELIEIEPERLHGQGVIEPLDDVAPLAAGFGWQRYPQLLASNRHLFSELVDVQHPRARYVLSLGAAALRAGKEIEPKSLCPAYLRQKVAARSKPVS